VQVKKDLWYVVVLHFLGINRDAFVLVLDLVALVRTLLEEVTAGLTLISPVTDLKKKKHI